MPLQDQSDDVLDFDIDDEDIFPRGLLPAVVVEVEKRQGDKAPYLATQFELQGGNWDSMTVYLNITLSRNPFARHRSRATIEAIVNRQLTNSEDIPKLISEMLGRPCQVQMGKREFEGAMRPNVEKVLPARVAPGFDSDEKESTQAHPAKSSGVGGLFDEQEDIPF